MKVDNKTLEAWLQEAESREEDFLVLDKYKQKDTNKIKELRQTIKRLNEEAMQNKCILQDRITRTRTNNIQIDKAFEELDEFKKQRKNVLSKWEGTVNFLKTRDANIDHMKTNVAREKENQIRETIRFLNEQHSNATEMERKIQDIESFLSQLKLQVSSNEKSLVDFKSEMDSLKRQTDRTAQELDKVRKTVTYYKKEKSRRTEK
ncbi:Coiled-coil domain-containing protein 39 [Cichlidogyrus casuarinus]|uniref:Coiled-coil domain-containing protein 39 n=1 Tax=Cichlidogyrus casuarinus TaxID=1844966 RepID=A0ABD2QFE4_9PLAT